MTRGSALAGAPLHVRLPWAQCQRQAPAAAAVLQEARAVWGPPNPVLGPHLPRPTYLAEPLRVRRPGAHWSPAATMQSSGGAAAAEDTRIGSAGPLLVFPDTR